MPTKNKISPEEEHTPLLPSVPVATRPPRLTPSNAIIRRFCTTALASILTWFFLAFLIDLIIFHDHSDLFPYPPHDKQPPPCPWPSTGCGSRRGLGLKELEKILIETPSGTKAEEWSRYYTSGVHVAGRNYSQAEWTGQKWEEWGVVSEIIPYEVYLNYPVEHRLALLNRKDDHDDDDDGEKEQAKKGEEGSWKVAYEASLEEDILTSDPTTNLSSRVPTFHGYSASGNVTAPVVYVNYGSYQDFEDLQRANISLEGKIAIARYGGIFRGLKVKRAQELGMVGVLLYSDPGDDGNMTEVNGHEAYPEGPARQPSSVQRGSVQFLSFAAGDPTTPGYPSKPGVPRQPVHTAIPSIPSIPISYQDALPILKALNGHGPKADTFNKYWTRNLGLKHKGVEYNVGPTPDDVVVNLYNKQEYVTTPIWNVIGIVNGTLLDEIIVVGNHRDAWVAGGAGDPNSGSAVLNEVVRAFGEALKAGWKPLRTIVFASWDGEEYGLVGSTEWVEEYLPWLTHASVAYINIDTAVTGTHLKPSAAPLLFSLLHNVTHLIPSPAHDGNQTINSIWDKKIRTMGSGSDFVAFQDHAGIPSLHIGFDPAENDPVYHYHSNYDSFHWMKTFGDPEWKYHRAMAQLVGVVTGHLASKGVIPFKAEDYASALKDYVKKVEVRLEEVLSPSNVTLLSETDLLDNEIYFPLRASLSPSPNSSFENDPSIQKLKHSLRSLRHSLAHFTHTAESLDHQAAHLSSLLEYPPPWWNFPARLRFHHTLKSLHKINRKYKLLERSFLYRPGLDGRRWFKHVVFAPGLWTGYAGEVFPSLMESIQRGDWENARRWVGIVEGRVKKATKRLRK